jgi:hypothetical protein
MSYKTAIQAPDTRANQFSNFLLLRIPGDGQSPETQQITRQTLYCHNFIKFFTNWWVLPAGGCRVSRSKDAKCILRKANPEC